MEPKRTDYTLFQNRKVRGEHVAKFSYDTYQSDRTGRILIEWKYNDTHGAKHSGITRTIARAKARAQQSSKESIHDNCCEQKESGNIKESGGAGGVGADGVADQPGSECITVCDVTGSGETGGRVSTGD